MLQHLLITKEVACLCVTGQLQQSVLEYPRALHFSILLAKKLVLLTYHFIHAKTIDG